MKITTSDIKKILTDVKAKNTDKTINYIVNIKKDDLNGVDVFLLLFFALNKEKVFELLKNDVNKLTATDFNSLLKLSGNKKQIGDLLMKTKTNLISDNNNIYSLAKYYPNVYTFALWLLKNKNDLTGDNAYTLLRFAPNKVKMCNIIGKNNINKLDDADIYKLATNSVNKLETSLILVDCIGDDINVEKIINTLLLPISWSEKEEIINKFFKIKGSKLSKNDLCKILSAYPIYINVVKLLIKNKIKISDKFIKCFVKKIDNKKEFLKNIKQYLKI